MNSISRALAVMTLAVASGGAAPVVEAAGAVPQDFPGITRLMKPEEFRAAGLDKLSAAELEALDAWLLHYTATDAELVSVGSEQVQDAKMDYRVEAKIVPPFNGWSGKTVFRLDNGQVWQQRIAGRFHYAGPETAVVIKRNKLGFFVMTHVASGRTTGVEFVD